MNAENAPVRVFSQYAQQLVWKVKGKIMWIYCDCVVIQQKLLGQKGSLLDWAKQPLKPVTSPSLNVHSNAKTLNSIPEDPVQHLLSTREALQKTTSEDASLQQQIDETCELVSAMLEKMELEKEENEESMILLRAENADLRQELLEKQEEIEELKDALRETLKENEMVSLYLIIDSRC